MTLFDRDIQFVDHIGKEREINDTPNDKIDPDEVRINKLEGLVDYQYRRLSWTTPIADRLKRCLDNINCESEHYTTEEIKDALCGHLYHDDIIIFLLKPYMENL